jgi:transaldolase
MRLINMSPRSPVPTSRPIPRRPTPRFYSRKVDQLPSAEVLGDIDAKVDFAKLEEVLMTEGLAKFADPFKKLLQTIASKR